MEQKATADQIEAGMDKEAYAFQEIERLRRENAELRARLAISTAADAAPIIHAGEPELPILGEGLSAVDTQAPVQEKINLFRTLFRGREDVYATLWINEQAGKKGYKPACEGPWDWKTKTPKKYLPLTDQVIKDHLSGKSTVGIYPLLNENACLFLACDFDKGGWLLDALAYMGVCKRYNIPAYLERSRSGNGGHVWIFFSAAVSAALARQLGMRLLRETMDSRGDLDMGSYDRFFPNQDFVPNKGGFGNLIALPLQKKCRAMGNTEFLDTTSAEMRPWPDQWAFLSRVQRIAPARLDELLQMVPALAVGTSAGAQPTAAVIARHPAPETIRCVLGGVMHMEKSGIPPWLLSRIKHLASLHNPEFHKREKMRFSTFQTPRFIRCYDEDLSHLHLPRGLFDQIEDLVKESGSRLATVDKRPTPQKLTLSFQGALRPEQEKAVEALLAHDMGVLVAPPGAGKTVMGCAAIAKRNVPALVLANRKPLLEQWRSQLMTFLNLASKDIGQVGGGRDSQRGSVDLAMIQSLARRENLDTFFAGYGFVIVDECHHIPAVEFQGCIKKAPARYFLGLTATPYRRDGLQEIISMQCGPIRHEMGKSGDAMPLSLIVRETAFGYMEEDSQGIQVLFKKLAQDEMRNSMIVQDVLAAAAKGRRCLILGQRKDHCAALVAALSGKGLESFMLNGLQGKKQRTALLKAVHETPADKPLVVVATGQYLGEGFDCPQMDALFMASPSSFKGRLVQYVGRVLRKHPGKRNALVYDYVDSQVGVLKSMYYRRLKAYKTLGAVEMEA